jgi:hypothetical protein
MHFGEGGEKRGTNVFSVEVMQSWREVLSLPGRRKGCKWAPRCSHATDGDVLKLGGGADVEELGGSDDEEELEGSAVREELMRQHQGGAWWWRRRGGAFEGVAVGKELARGEGARQG